MKTTTLGDCVNHQKGFAFKSSLYRPSGRPIARVSDFTSDSIDLRCCLFISEDDALEFKNYELMEGDVVITTVGSWPSNPASVVAKVVRVPKKAKHSLLNQNAVKLSPKDNINHNFLYYLLRSSAFKDYIISTAQGSANQASITLKDIFKFEFGIPEISKQEAIGNILIEFDRKIENNNQINENLELFAKLLFKEWFIDFGPVRSKIENKRPSSKDTKNTSIFPFGFEKSDLGEVPTGWKITSLNEISDFQEGPGIMAVDFHKSGVALIRLAGLKNGVSLLDGCNFLSPDKVKLKWDHFRLKQGDILLSTSASLGRVAEVDDIAEGSIAYTGIIRFRPIPTLSNQTFLKHFLISPSFQSQVEAFGFGSVLKHFGPTHLKMMKVLVPPIEIQDEFANVVQPIDKLLRNNIQENHNLERIRDLLLQKLISGELQLNGVAVD